MECPSCKQRLWIEFGETYDRSDGVFDNKKQKQQIDEKILRQDRKPFTRLPFANQGHGKPREICFSTMNKKYKTIDDKTDKLQQLKNKRNLRFQQDLCIKYDQIDCMRQSKTFNFEEELFVENVQSISFIKHIAL